MIPAQEHKTSSSSGVLLSLLQVLVIVLVTSIVVTVAHAYLVNATFLLKQLIVSVRPRETWEVPLPSFAHAAVPGEKSEHYQLKK